jgi:hypothetical protein
MLDFNCYLEAPIPGTEGMWLQVSMTTQMLKFLANTNFTRFFGVQEGIEHGFLTPMCREGTATFSSETLAHFSHQQYAISWRYELSWLEENSTIPILDVRVVRLSQTDSVSLITTLDVTSMNGGYIPLNIYR